MSAGDDIGNRHRLPADGLAASQLHEAQSVRICISRSWAASHAGQLLLSCLVNLLCRQVDIVRRIEICVPEISPQIWLPTEGQNLSDALVSLASWAVAGRVEVEPFAPTGIADFLVVIGDGSEVPERDARIAALCAIGDGWKAWVGELDCAPRGCIPRSTDPLGPFFAASLVAGEVFKRTRGLMRGKYLTSHGYSLWSGGTNSSWAELEDGPSVAGRILAPVHLLGAGAVGNGVAYVIASSMLQSAYVVVIDDDLYDATNLNRCPLAGIGNKDQKKAEVLAAMLRTAGVGAFDFPGTVRDYVIADRNNLRRDVAARVDQLLFDVVLSCVDKGTSRQDVQGLWPAMLLGGSTLGMMARTNAYRTSRESACLACHNPSEKHGEQLRALEKRLRQMTSAELAQFCLEAGINANDVGAYLSGAPCGSLGETAIKDLATRPQTNFSVGFVSMGAAVLLSAQMFRRLLFADSASPRADMTTLNFLNGGMLDAGLAPDLQCEQRCGDRN